MANSTNTNPIVLDTFSSDITISAERMLHVRAIVFRSGTASDRLIISRSLDGTGADHADLTTAANSQAIFAPAEPVELHPPIYVDVSRGTYAATAIAYIYTT